MEKESILLAPTMDDWVMLRAFIDSFCTKHRISDSMSLSLQLVCEEWFTNIVRHGFHSREVDRMDETQAVHVSVWIRERGVFVITFTDHASPFNPLEHQIPDTMLPAERRAMGGLGIHLIRSIMDRCEYSRVENKNVLTMYKNMQESFSNH
jgi:serine/threonine-protein kinase RsbW